MLSNFITIYKPDGWNTIIVKRKIEIFFLAAEINRHLINFELNY